MVLHFQMQVHFIAIFQMPKLQWNAFETFSRRERKGKILLGKAVLAISNSKCLCLCQANSKCLYLGKSKLNHRLKKILLQLGPLSQIIWGVVRQAHPACGFLAGVSSVTLFTCVFISLKPSNVHKGSLASGTWLNVGRGFQRSLGTSLLPLPLYSPV